MWKAFKAVVDTAKEATGRERLQQALGGGIRGALDLLLSLLGLYWLQNDMGDFVEDGELSICFFL